MWYQHRGETLGISLDFVKEQRVTFETLCQIVTLHKERYDLFDLLRRTKDRTFMKILFNQITEIEYELQMLWGFEPNAIHHKSWRWPNCKCPQMDKQDWYPVAQVYNSRCPLHRDLIFTKNKINKNVKSI